MKKAGIVAVIAVGALSGLFAIAGRGLWELAGYAQAGADVAADGLTSSISVDVHDRKLDRELERSRQELVDRQTQIISFKPQIADLERGVSDLNSRIERRERLLVEAYPVLKEAVDADAEIVRFANDECSLDDFRRDLDELLAMQEHEKRECEIKRESLRRLADSVSKGEFAIAEMRLQVEQAEQKIAMLRGRREHAEIESETLNLVAAATAERKSVLALMSVSIDKLEKDVAHIESRNQSRRTMAVAGASREKSLSRQWSRMERLAAIIESTSLRADAEPVATESRKFASDGDVIRTEPTRRNSPNSPELTSRS